MDENKEGYTVKKGVRCREKLRTCPRN